MEKKTFAMAYTDFFSLLACLTFEIVLLCRPGWLGAHNIDEAGLKLA